MPEPLLIADVPWLLYRSFFALPKSIVDADGKPVNALLGTVNALLSVLDARSARAVVACMGAEQASYRVELYPPYHAHRDPMPPELAAQWQRAPRLLSSLGWVLATSEDLEADDVMYSFALSEQEHGGEALLLSGDRDMFAAVSERVALIELGKGSRLATIGPEQVRERYGIDPEQVADFIALRGDPSDGLPGAPGIGAKTAAVLLRGYGSLEALLGAAQAAGGERAELASVAACATTAPEELRARTAAILRESAALLSTFKQVATLQRIDVARPADRPTDFAAGASVAREMGMRRLAERLEKLSGATA